MCALHRDHVSPPASLPPTHEALLNGDAHVGRRKQAWATPVSAMPPLTRGRLVGGVVSVVALASIVLVCRATAHSVRYVAFPEPAMAEEELIRGVSLGGWLVVEPFIAPSIFRRANEALRAAQGPDDVPGYTRVVDQWTLCALLGPDVALSILRPHWESFVTFQDLRRLRDAGINTLRIPVPYWMVDVTADEPWVGQNETQAALGRVLRWASRIGLKAFIDLHAGPGSQNGFDNSGHWGTTEWQVETSAGLPNVDRTLRVWRKLCAFLLDTSARIGVAPQTLYAGFELVNEAPLFNPAIDRDVLRAFLVEGYFLVRGAMGSDKIPIYVHDGFFPHSWEDFMQGSAFKNVRLDRHEYHVFEEPKMHWSWDEHLEFACQQALSIARTQRVRPTIVGEWSLATHDCDLWLNGYDKGSRWEGTFPTEHPPIGSCEGYRQPEDFSPEYLHFLREFGAKQMAAWDVGGGWVFWNFKTENGSAPHFDYLLGVERGYLPHRAGPVNMLGCPARIQSPAE